MKSTKMTPHALVYGLPKPINIFKMIPSKMAAPPPPPTGKQRPDPHQGCVLRKTEGSPAML